MSTVALAQGTVHNLQEGLSVSSASTSLTQAVEMPMTKLIMVSDRLFMRKSKSPNPKANDNFSLFVLPFLWLL